jgi:hypothetical protein
MDTVKWQLLTGARCLKKRNNSERVDSIMLHDVPRTSVLGLEFLHFREGASIQDLAERTSFRLVTAVTFCIQARLLVGPLRFNKDLGF